MRLPREWLSRAGEGTEAACRELLENEKRGDATRSTILVMRTLEQKRCQFIFGGEIYGWDTRFQTPQPCLPPVNIPSHVPEGNVCTEDQPGPRSPTLSVGSD